MSAYFIAHRRKITDPETLKDYNAGVDRTIRAFGGEVIVREDSFDVLEGEWEPGRNREDSRPERITIIRFPDRDALKAWYESEDYGRLKKIRLSSSSSDAVAVEGL